MRFLLSSLLVLSLAACGHPTEPLAVKAMPTKLGSLSDLELATAQLREQHEAMGETLNWMEGEVMAMKAGGSLKDAARQPAIASASEAEASAPAEAPVKAEAAATEPTKLAPETAPASAAAEPPEPAEVGGLSEDDLKVDAAPEASTAPSAPAVHLASYLDKKQVMPGWEKLKAQHTKLLEGLTPTTTEFKDDKGQLWYRLYAGPFASAAEAAERCKAIKGAGGWCE